MSSGSRHFHLHDVEVAHDAVIGYGLSDAPMTHSADGNKHAERSYGPLRLTLTPAISANDAGDGS